MRARTGLAFALALAAGARLGAVTLVGQGSTWKYLDDGSSPAATWKGSGFDDTSWSSGPAQLGYGDGDESTVVDYGPNPSAKYTTTYFRHTFSVTGAAGISTATLGLLRDDGAVVYLNGTEVFRSNMPAGSITSGTFASTAVGGSGETTFFQSAVNPALFVEGTNLLAVEVHQANLTSSDSSFDLTLSATTASLAVSRGPYLQVATPESIVVRWRTNLSSSGVVRYGPTPGSSAFQSAGATGTEHVVELAPLSPDTLYYYSVGDDAGALAGGDATHFFRTPPATGTRKPTRIWALGDSGTANSSAIAVRNAFVGFTGSRGQELWLMLGDNAYDDGTDLEYQTAVFDIYPAILRNTPLWPTLGNHDGHTADSTSETGPYYEIFTLPRDAEAGGVESGTEAYYSFDYANIHFICLDSYETSRLPGGAMLSWLEDDLAATTADWTIAFWHHPPYSKGSHDSDVDTEMVQMRANVLPILESYGVDLVLTGHSHSYERSFLVDGHYGTSGTLNPSMIVDGGDGDPAGDGVYEKPTLGPASNQGAVYAVAGSGGQVSGGSLNHPIMVVSLAKLGSMAIDVDGRVLEARFVNSTGGVDDVFRIEKGPPPECKSSEECEDPVEPICDPATSACRGCEEDEECAAEDPSLAACLPSGACSECSATNTAACTGAEPVCHVDSGVCVECVTSGDCSDGQVCLVASKVCVECLDAGDCSKAEPVCDGENSCNGCGSDAECGAIDPASPACQPSGACGECSASHQSACTGETPFCDVGAGLCVGPDVFADGFQSGDTSAWDATVP